MPVMATRAKSTFLICPNILSSLFLLFCLIFFFSLFSLSLSLLFSAISPAPTNHNFRTFERCGCPPEQRDAITSIWAANNLHCYFYWAAFVCPALLHPSSHNISSLDSFSHLTTTNFLWRRYHGVKTATTISLNRLARVCVLSRTCAQVAAHHPTTHISPPLYNLLCALPTLPIQTAPQHLVTRLANASQDI